MKLETGNRSDASLRPLAFRDFIGQDTIRHGLEVLVNTARERGDVLDHVLLVGPPGYGKKTLAYIIANAMNANIKHYRSQSFENAGQLCGVLTNLAAGDIVFIEDIDRLRPEILGYLGPAMDHFEFKVDLEERTLRLAIPKFTLIGGAAHSEVSVASPLGRFRNTFHLDYYPTKDLEKIVLRSASLVGVPVDAAEASKIAKRSDGTPDLAINLLQVAASRLRLLDANSRSAWEEIPDILTNALWTLAEVRPDFEELPSWIIDGEAAIRDAEASQKVTTAVAMGRTIVRALANRYGDDADRVAVTHWNLKVSSSDCHSAPFLADVIEDAKRFRKEVQRLPAAIHDDEICVGKHVRVSFNRTLRIPENGKTYPLPAGFGRLPILRVEDYASKLPAKWLSEGGFIIPLYQREALFLEFSGVKWRPAIAKVSAGRINAVSGKSHDLAIRPHRQDYVVIPDQRWLDGINSGDGSVKQFVAMPLGDGYTIEAQITDEEKHGGFQLVIFDPKTGRFDEEDPDKSASAVVKRLERAFRARQQALVDSMPDGNRRVFRMLQEHHYLEAAKRLTITPEDILAIIKDLRSRFEDVLGPNGFEGVIPHKNLPTTGLFSTPLRSQSLFAAKPGLRFMPSTDQPFTGLNAPEPRRVEEMGIAAGGRIKQQILDDEYGADSWDPNVYRDIVIHIVNSAVFEEITGRPPPESPITVAQYQSHKIPWYSNYEETATSVGPAGIFRKILSVGQIDKQRGRKDQADDRSIRPITGEEIIRVRVPTLEERVNTLVKRSQQSLKAGRYKIAAREASLAVNIIPSHPFPLLLRAQANLHLGFHSDAEADASACLELDPSNISALGVRALSCLRLGEILLAKTDASKVLESDPKDKDALFVRAQANLGLLKYKEAFEDANRLLEHDRSNAQALRIKDEARTKLSPDVQLAIPPERAPAFAALAQKMINEGVDTPERVAAFIDEAIGTKGRPFSQALWDAIADVKPHLRGRPDWSAIYSRAPAAPLAEARP